MWKLWRFPWTVYATRVGSGKVMSNVLFNHISSFILLCMTLLRWLQLPCQFIQSYISVASNCVTISLPLICGCLWLYVGTLDERTKMTSHLRLWRHTAYVWYLFYWHKLSQNIIIKLQKASLLGSIMHVNLPQDKVFPSMNLVKNWLIMFLMKQPICFTFPWNMFNQYFINVFMVCTKFKIYMYPQCICPLCKHVCSLFWSAYQNWMCIHTFVPLVL